MANAIDYGDTRYFCKCGAIFSLFTLIKYIQMSPLDVYQSYSSLLFPNLWISKMFWNSLQVKESSKFIKYRPRGKRYKIVIQGGRVVL